MYFTAHKDGLLEGLNIVCMTRCVPAQESSINYRVLFSAVDHSQVQSAFSKLSSKLKRLLHIYFEATDI